MLDDISSLSFEHVVDDFCFLDVEDPADLVISALAGWEAAVLTVVGFEDDREGALETLEALKESLDTRDHVSLSDTVTRIFDVGLHYW